MDASGEPQNDTVMFAGLAMNSVVIAGLALIVGIGLGLLYGWVISPVEWTDATPELLRPDLRVDYLRMAIDSYSVNRDADLATERYRRLGEHADETLQQVGADPGEVDPTAIQNFSAVVEIMDEPSEGEAAEEGSVIEGEQGEESAPAGSTAMRLIFPVCGATLLLGVLLVAVLYLRGRLAESGEEEPILDPGFDMEEEFDLGDDFEDTLVNEGFEQDLSSSEPFVSEETGFRQAPKTEPLATFRTIYTLGDDHYDDAFSIESPAGDFLGECGVGIGDVMGAGEPKKVSGFEVWLFDKNDIQTVTVVLMSEYAYRDEDTRAQLAAKGEPVLAEPGGVINLETASLSVEARVVDMSYGESALPEDSFFESMTIEIRAYPKGA